MKAKIEMLPVKDVIATVDNPRHLAPDDAKVLELAESIKASSRREGTSGVLTASGRTYDERSATIALPFHPPRIDGRRKWGRKYRITNLRTGKSIVAGHWDYGPGQAARSRNVVADLSPAVFEALGGRIRDGRILVKVEGLAP